ncbi:uncharacterized protein B0T15DRAFT_181636 [Chaetomium strumarium]|uniref:4'-phosphopantetheinyl transferase domain-containing protein n=1 Tax=Chaetomium strumarium TaxID=1170767 RepID=A0AAJ0M3F6_9PEZI|nr:hypothetical protein B0T15DRAFT_181636 [Chaetomium strumarium]
MPPPLPFPYPLRIGTDLCRISRIQRILQGKNGPRFIHRVLAPEELVHVRPVMRAVLDDAVRGSVAKAAAGSAGGTGVRRPISPTTRERELWGREWEGGGKLEVPEEEQHRHDESYLQGERKRDGLSGEEGEEGGFGLYKSAATFLAGRWAAKEAAFKAHPHLRLGFHDVLILSPAEMEAQTGDQPLQQQAWQAKGAPVAVIKPGEGRRDQIAMVSITHDGNYASAVCIGFESGQEGREREQRSGWFPRLSRLWL